MSSSKRHFTVVIGNKENGLYISSTPSSAAKKAVSKLCADNKKKKVEFYIRETTQGSNKKVYGPYIGYMQKLDKPVELNGRVIRYKPIVKLHKKGGKMKGGRIIGKGEEGIVFCPNIINNRENRVSKLVINDDIELIRSFEQSLNIADPEGKYHVPMRDVKSIEEKNKNKIQKDLHEDPFNEEFNIIITYDYGGISLTDFLDKNESEYKIEITKEFYLNLLLGFVNIFEGLIIFYENGICHNDIGHRNIVFFTDHPQNMRMIDFMLPRKRTPNFFNYTFIGDLLRILNIIRYVNHTKMFISYKLTISSLYEFLEEKDKFIESIITSNSILYNRTKSYKIELDKIIQIKNEMRERIEAL